MPSAPTAVVASRAGSGRLSVDFAPGSDGGDSQLLYVVESVSPSAAVLGQGSARPVVVSGLVNAQSYQLTVRAVNTVGSSAASTASAAVSPGQCQLLSEGFRLGC